MDLATLIGFLATVGVVFGAIAFGGSIGLVLDMPALLIVVGGSAGVVLMRFNIKQFFGAVKIGLIVLFHKSEKTEDIIKQVVLLSDISRRQGMLALQEVEIKNKFLKQAIQYVVDGLEPEIIETLLYKDLTLTIERHVQGQQIFKALGEVAPSMGLIGTLIGLIQMLSNLGDPKSLGPSMAMAMLTTLYGAILANIIAIPIAEKLELRSREEKNIKLLIIDAVMGIQRGQNPRLITDILKAYLPGSARDREGDNADEENKL